MKKRKPFAMLFAVLGVGILSAQTDVTSTYLTNTDFETSPIDFTVENNGTVNSSSTRIGDKGWVYTIPGWTNASVIGNNAVQIATAEYGLSTSSASGLNSTTPPTKDNNDNAGAALHMSAGWGDDAIVTQTSKEDLQPGVYELTYSVNNRHSNTNIATNFTGITLANGISFTGSLSTAPQDQWISENIGFAVTETQGATFKLGFTTSNGGSGDGAKLYIDNLKLTHKPFTDVTEENPVDLTSMAGNTAADWTFHTGVKDGEQKNITYDGITVVQCYATANYTGDAMIQAIEGLPSGNYNVEVYCMAHSAWITDVYSDEATGYTYLYANEKSVDVPVRTADVATTKQLYTIEDIAVNNGTLTIRVHNAQAGPNWISASINKITYLGPDKSLEEESFNNNITALKGLSTDNIPTAFATKISNLISTYGNNQAEQMTLTELMTANAEIKAVIDVHPSMATAYTNLKTLIGLCTGYANNSDADSDEALSTFNTAIEKANKTVDEATAEATAVEALNTAYNDLESARQTYVMKAIPTNGTTFDLTFKVVNPTFDNGKTDGWTYTTGASNHGIASKNESAITGNFFENWDWNSYIGNIEQTLIGLPTGVYTLKAAAFRDQLIDGASDADAVYVFGNDAETLVSSPTSVMYTVEDVLTFDGKITLGVKSKVKNYRWMGIDNVSLSYAGKTLAFCEEGLQQAITRAEAVLSELNPAVKDILTQRITKANAAKTTEDRTMASIEQATSELNEATEFAKNIATVYAKVNTLLNISNGYTENSTPNSAEDLSAFNTAITKATNDKETATTLDALNTVYNDLESARQAYVVKAIPTNGTTFDLTFKVVNPTFDVDVTGWTGGQKATNKNDAITPPYAEKWNGNSYVGTIEQTVTGLPMGAYIVKAAAFRQDAITTEADAVYVFGNDAETLVTSGTPTMYTVTDVLTYDGKITLGIKSKVAIYKWMGIDNVSLIYAGKTLAFCEEGLQQSITKAQEVLNTVNPAVKAALTEEITVAQAAIADGNKTIASLEQAISSLTTATESASSTASIYAKVNALVETCSNYTTNSTPAADEDLTAFNAAIDKANEDKETATTADALNTVYSTLERARQTYAVKAYPTGDVAFDMTFLIENPTFNGNTDGWTVNTGKWHSNSGYDGVSGIAEIANWGANSWSASISQNISLPNGKYKVKVAAQASANDTELKLTANEVSASLTCIGDQGGNIAADGSVVELGSGVAGWQYIEVECIVTNETLSIAANSSATAAHCWANVDNFTLYRSYDVEIAQKSVASLLSEANTLTGKVMNKDVATALASAISGANAESTDLSALTKMDSQLRNAITDTKASIAAYELIPTHIAKANKIDNSIAEAYQTAYDNRTLAKSAETVFQELEVATYNYVTKNFTYAVKLSDTWNSTGTNTEAATFSNEHWSGETREYKNQKDGDNQGWGANAWTIDFDQEVTLPAGEYVFKVAGRKSPDTALELVVTKGEAELGKVNDFPSTNEGLGINKAGAASFDTNDAEGFAKDGKGYGWQWRYVKFELTSEATVKVAVHAETDKKYNWVSFGDYTLQMTEETYLEANKGGLDAPTAEAETLVDTKPMGDAENQALKDALAMTYTTGAQLFAKIDALETAVANAKAWLKAYNEAKVPLVAALERFETDYNDGENGAKQHMAKSRWATVVATAGAASEAKDVTNSYDGFAEATKNLTDALAAADVSIKEYAALNEAIKKANEISASKVNWGDKPFQRPASAKDKLSTTTAQGVYDAAEADGEGVTSATSALTNAIAAANILNAPAEGDAFYMTVAVAGHVYEGYPIVATLGTLGDNNNPTGYGFTAKTNDAKAPKLFTFTKVAGNSYNISFEMDGTTVYLTYGSLNGSAASWNKQQIQGTTVAENKGIFSIEASVITEGAINILNTVTNTYLDCQDGGSIYTDDNITKDEFGIIAQDTKLSASINIPYENKFTTCVLMFDAVLPNGLKAYKYSSVEKDCLILQEISGTVPAYTPCLLHAEYEFEGTLEGTLVMDGYSTTVTKDNILHGAVKQQTITEGYTLQKEEGADVAFYAVGNEQEVVIPAGECWLSVIKDIAAETIYLTIAEGGTVGIDKAQIDLSILNGAIYTLDGKKVNSMLPGQIYIINGKKVMVK